MILGITGGISTGKTTAADKLAAEGMRVIDCDEISRYLTTYDPCVLGAIREHFGCGVFHPGGALNRSAVGRIVFSSERERQVLEQILHPVIIDVVTDNVRCAREWAQPLVVVAPLLIESGMRSIVDHLWVISCTAATQLERLCRRSGVSEDEAQRWIDAQMPLSEKERLADTVIRNDDSIDTLQANVLKEWLDLTKE